MMDRMNPIRAPLINAWKILNSNATILDGAFQNLGFVMESTIVEIKDWTKVQRFVLGKINVNQTNFNV
jgi:hypothetical protein